MSAGAAFPILNPASPDASCVQAGGGPPLNGAGDEGLESDFSSLFRQVAEERLAAHGASCEPQVPFSRRPGTVAEEAAEAAPIIVPALTDVLPAWLAGGSAGLETLLEWLSVEDLVEGGSRGVGKGLAGLRDVVAGWSTELPGVKGSGDGLRPLFQSAAARVAQAVASVVGGKGRLVVRLYPPQLGTVWIKASSAGGLLRVEVKTSRAEAQGLLLRSVGEMRRRLEEAGIVVDRFDVTTFENQGQNQRETSGRRNRRGVFRLLGTSEIE